MLSNVYFFCCILFETNWQRTDENNGSNRTLNTCFFYMTISTVERLLKIAVTVLGTWRSGKPVASINSLFNNVNEKSVRQAPKTIRQSYTHLCVDSHFLIICFVDFLANAPIYNSYWKRLLRPVGIQSLFVPSESDCHAFIDYCIDSPRFIFRQNKIFINELRVTFVGVM